jgi:hypothetical protein
MKLFIMHFFQLRVICSQAQIHISLLPKLPDVRALIPTTMIRSVSPAIGRCNAHKCNLMQRLSPVLLFSSVICDAVHSRVFGCDAWFILLVYLVDN